MKITPHVNLLRSLRGERIDYVLLIGEGVDNALDANATSVAITFDDDEVKFVDDGSGIIKTNIAALFSLGQHGAQSTTALGRFGVGITTQAVNAGDRFWVLSTSTDGRFRAHVNWPNVLKSGEWEMENPSWLPVEVGAATGTTISIHNLRKPPKVGLDKIVDDLALRFYPALASGRVIKVNGRKIPAMPEPRLIDIVECQLSLSDGRGAHLRAGILAAPSKINMVHVGYKHRVIMPGCRIGCGSYSGLSKMFARIQLSGPWHLAKFKNDLTDEEERDELEEAAASALAPILEKCHSESLTARVRHIASLVNASLPEELKPSRPRKIKPANRESGEQKGKGLSGIVASDRSDEVDKGPAKSKRRPKDQIIINFDGNDADQGVGRFIAGRPHCINLSPDNDYIMALMALRDEDIVVKSLQATALCIFLHEVSRHNGELELEEFGKRLAQLLAMQTGDIALPARKTPA